MMTLEPPTSSAQELPSKPSLVQEETKLDFDKSDESIEEENLLDAELSRLLIDKLSIFNL